MSTYDPQTKYSKDWRSSDEERPVLMDDDREYFIRWLKKHRGLEIDENLIQHARKDL